MSTGELISEINKLPVNERLVLIEQTIKAIRREEKKEQRKHAVELLYDDYMNDKELTAFTDLDQEDFYEAR